MGVRESLNQQNPKVVFAITAGIIVIAAAVVVSLWRSGNGGVGSVVPHAFFSIDDGKTWFLDDAKKLPPYPRDGKEAVRAYVYQCGDGKQFVAFLERYTPEAKKQREAFDASGGRDALRMLDQSSGLEVKVPGQPTWVRQSDPRAIAIMSPKCPTGGEAQMVLP